jgi:hypothetical protein
MYHAVLLALLFLGNLWVFSHRVLQEQFILAIACTVVLGLIFLPAAKKQYKKIEQNYVGNN